MKYKKYLRGNYYTKRSEYYISGTVQYVGISKDKNYWTLAVMNLDEKIK